MLEENAPPTGTAHPADLYQYLPIGVRGNCRIDKTVSFRGRILAYRRAGAGSLEARGLRRPGENNRQRGTRHDSRYVDRVVHAVFGRLDGRAHVGERNVEQA